MCKIFSTLYNPFICANQESFILHTPNIQLEKKANKYCLQHTQKFSFICGNANIAQIKGLGVDGWGG